MARGDQMNEETKESLKILNAERRGVLLKDLRWQDVVFYMDEVKERCSDVEKPIERYESFQDRQGITFLKAVDWRFSEALSWVAGHRYIHHYLNKNIGNDRLVFRYGVLLELLRVMGVTNKLKKDHRKDRGVQEGPNRYFGSLYSGGIMESRDTTLPYGLQPISQQQIPGLAEFMNSPGSLWKTWSVFAIANSSGAAGSCDMNGFLVVGARADPGQTELLWNCRGIAAKPHANRMTLGIVGGYGVILDTSSLNAILREVPIHHPEEACRRINHYFRWANVRSI